MASIGNVLARNGGTPATGRPITFHVWEEKDDGSAFNHEITGLLRPVLVEGAHAVERETVEFMNELGTLVGIKEEYNLRFLAAALRDPEKPQARLVLAKELHIFRRGVPQEDIKALLAEYETLIRTEFPESATARDFEAMKAEAKGFTADGQTESGPSSP